MKKIALSVLALILCFTAPVIAQGTVSLSIVSELSGEDDKKVIEVPEIYLDQKGAFKVTVPVPFEERYWICGVSLFEDCEFIYARITDPKSIQLAKNGAPLPLEVLQAEIPLVWNAPMTLIKIDDRSLTVTLTLKDPPKKTSIDSKKAIKATKWGNVPDGILKRLDVSFSFDKKNQQIRGRMYNPTQYQFTEFSIQIVVPKSDGFPGLDRVYRTLNIDGNPLSDGTFSVGALLPEFPKDTEPIITIKSATGRIAN